MDADTLAHSRRDIEELLRQICETKEIQQSNNDCGEYAEKIQDKMDVFKGIINFALNMQEAAETEAIRVFTYDFLGVMIPKLENAKYDCVDTREELDNIERDLRQLISFWNSEALMVDVIQEMR
ncbi:hypothetical protein CRE_07874 [Caenorhabditis remanei]|uniref:Uncharacterized protein n=1 Tax=Caenorhabditis remanei TaxID=31234 RepID=E3NL38_CAERE|nr:hypothetical protein CRE_07874 [Caenorhabditis remanei]